MTENGTPGKENTRLIEKGAWRNPGTIISVLFTVLAIYLVFTVIDFRDVFALLSEARLDFLALGFGFYCLVYVFRILRYQIFPELKRVPFFSLLRITSIHYIMNMLLPARLGELTFPVLLRRQHDIRFGEGTSFLVLVRLYDFLGMALNLLLGIFIYSLRGGEGLSTGFKLAAGGLFIIMLALTIALKPISALMLKWWKFLAEKPAIKRVEFIEKLTPQLESAVAVVADNASSGRALPLLSYSLVIWILLYALYWAIIVAVGYGHYSFVEVMIGSSGGIITNVLPVNTAGSWGTLEAGWAASFYLVGMPVEDGLLTGFAQHAMLLIYGILILPIAQILVMLTRREDKQPS